ncbi:endogenous retrovirus group 3 member 1 Env polyprotein-like [Narcine bancroftii]|uniref:endogenous retrovirus group 3 member 1 Env polyprotein-like n=1 Tax=Narcine bancroftii TaxID=1343680 RepID=UPI003831EF71
MITISPHESQKNLFERARIQVNRHRLGDNLWVDLHQLTVRELGVRNCWICSGPTRDGTWPWRGEPLDDRTLLASNISTSASGRSREFWKLENHPQGFKCLVKEHGRYPKGDLACRRWKNITSGNWVPAPPTGFLSLSNQSDVPCVPLVPINYTSDLVDVGFWNWTGFNPYQAIPALRSFWENSSPSGYAPDGLYWICGNMAYTYLEPDWSGTCCIGMIQPHFHLLPPDSDKHISTRLHSPIQHRSVEIGRWGDDWPPERIISYYGPATWAQDGSWGYRTPIYMLNHLIRLQAVLEIITNQTATALDLFAEEQQQIRATVYQNRPALDYLLAAEGGVCGKLNLSNCCLKIDDKGQAVKDISSGIRKLSHVPVQTWHPAIDSWFSKWFSGSWSWIHSALVFVAFIPLVLILIPCILPGLQCLVKRAVQQISPIMVLQQQNYAEAAENLLKLWEIDTSIILTGVKA